jgi:peptidoglycan hydrolase CwlO-like protein
MGKPLDAVHFQEEVGDSNWYNGIAAAALGKTVTEIEQQNIDKLTARYPEKFTTFLAENRDLAAERKALEGNKPEAPKPVAPAPVEPKKTEAKPAEAKTEAPKKEDAKPVAAPAAAAPAKTAEKK